jgi:hypothetical protein
MAKSGHPGRPYRVRRLPAFFYVGGIRPAEEQGADLGALLFPPDPADPEEWQEHVDAEPFTLDQANEIRALLGKAAKRTGAPEEEVSAAWSRIREAAEKARFNLLDEYKTTRLRAVYKAGQPKYKLKTELTRIGIRGRLSKKPNPHLLNALMYGAQRAGVLDAPDDSVPWDAAELLRSLSPAQLRLAAAAARDPEGGLHGVEGHPENAAVKVYIRKIVLEYQLLTGVEGVPCSRDKCGDPAGPLIALVRACLAPVAPELGLHGTRRWLEKLRADK